MSKLFSLIVPILLAATLLGCTEINNKKLKVVVDDDIPKVDALEVAPQNTHVHDFSEIIGNWNIVSFDDYRPSRLSSDGKNHAFVNFTDGHVEIRIECNYSGMPGKITASGILENLSPDDGMVATQMGCSPERQARDKQFFAFFNNAPEIEMISENTLRLTTNNHTLFLQKRMTSPSDLSGYWQLRYVDGVIALSSNQPRYDHLYFGFTAKNSGVSGFDGCNRIAARTKFIGSRIKLYQNVSQLRICEDEIARLSDGYKQILFADGTYEIDGLYLTIESKGKSYELMKLNERPARPVRFGNEHNYRAQIAEQNEAPQGVKLCEVRKPFSQEVFPDYPAPNQGRGGYTIRMLDDAIYFDHQDFVFGSTALSDISTPILFEKGNDVWVVQRVSPYQTQLHFGETGIYCTSEGAWKDGKVWPAYQASSQELVNLTNAKAPTVSETAKTAGTLIKNEECIGLKFKTDSSRTINLIFNHWEINTGHDEGGFYLKKNGKIFRVGDEIQGVIHPVEHSNARIIVENSLTFPNIGTSNMPACPLPSAVMMK